MSAATCMIHDSFQTLIFDKSVGIVVQLHVIETYGIMVMRALRHRGDGGKLIVMRLNTLEEYMTKLIDSTLLTAQAGNQSSFLSFCKMSLSVVRKRELDNTCLL